MPAAGQLPPGMSRDQVAQMQNMLPPEIKAQLRQPGGRERECEGLRGRFVIKAADYPYNRSATTATIRQYAARDGQHDGRNGRSRRSWQSGKHDGRRRWRRSGRDGWIAEHDGQHDGRWCWRSSRSTAAVREVLVEVSDLSISTFCAIQRSSYILTPPSPLSGFLRHASPIVQLCVCVRHFPFARAQDTLRTGQHRNEKQGRQCLKPHVLARL